MKVLRPKKRKVATRDYKKEAVFRKLSQILTDGGITVRREKLKRGHGWRVMSGSCKFEQEDLLFVDQRLSQDDQINLLISKLAGLKLDIAPETLGELPERIQKLVA